ncbi:MAG TPA: VWA domain-containing protein [Pyrinomonadaceae bacterium]|nr:VWA domain-containing protein [Pyrinomonadaceae bacterium]
MIRIVKAIVLTLVAALQTVNAQAADAPKTEPALLSVGLVVDNSGSYRLLLDRVIDLASNIVDQKGGDDEMFLVTFVDTSKIVLRQDFTHVKSDLHDAAENMFIEGGQTAILDALKFSARLFSESENAPANSQRILILISDGDERNSAAKLDDVLKLLKDEKIRVYVIAISDERLNTKLLDRIAKDTGGEKFVPKTRADIASVAKQIWPALMQKAPR